VRAEIGAALDRLNAGCPKPEFKPPGSPGCSSRIDPTTTWPMRPRKRSAPRWRAAGGGLSPYDAVPSAQRAWLLRGSRVLDDDSHRLLVEGGSDRPLRQDGGSFVDAAQQRTITRASSKSIAAESPSGSRPSVAAT